MRRITGAAAERPLDPAKTRHPFLCYQAPIGQRRTHVPHLVKGAQLERRAERSAVAEPDEACSKAFHRGSPDSPSSSPELSRAKCS
jgi:hypothetical protein